MFLAVYYLNSLYVECVLTKEEYRERFKRAYYRPMYQSFTTRDAAEGFMVQENLNARHKYAMLW